MNVSKVTLWHRLDSSENWQFNHIEDGWITRDKPESIDGQQTKAWDNSSWFKHYGLKDKDGRVYEHRNGV